MEKKAPGIIKKKKWVAIKAPALFDNYVIGESFVEETQQLVGRAVSVSLTAITGESTKNSTDITFLITQANPDNSVNSELVKYEILASSTRKMMRRRRDKIEDSFIVETSDKKAIRIKPLIITRNPVPGSTLATMRHLLVAYLAASVSKSSLDDLVREIITRKLQSRMSALLKKLHPVGVCEIRMFEVIPSQKIKDLGLKLTLPSRELADFKLEPRKRQASADVQQAV